MIFQKGIGANQFPDGEITQDWIDNLQPCDLVSPHTMDDPSVVINEPIAVVPELGSKEFEAEFVNVARSVDLAKSNARFSDESQDWGLLTCKHDGKNFISKYLSESFVGNEKYNIRYNIRTAKDLALLVHSDFPAQLILDLHRALKSEGAKIDKELFDAKPYKVFTNGIVGLEGLLSSMVRFVSPTAFAHKYHFKRPRPEEVANAWAKGEIEFDQVTDETLRHLIDVAEVANNPHSFTMYSEGCPTHPSLPAMHSAVAAMALLVKVLYNLTPEQEKEVEKFAANVAFGRTFAGVHYRLDNLYGLELGERAAAVVLPNVIGNYMSGADVEKLETKIAAKRVDWLAA